jgi:hypothetical protein
VAASPDFKTRPAQRARWTGRQPIRKLAVPGDICFCGSSLMSA